MTQARLEQLYDAHASGLFRYLVSVVKREADARDLLQELFSKVAREYRPDTIQQEKAWIYRVAHHLALDWLRRNQTRQAYELRAVVAASPLFAAAQDPDAQALARQLEEAMAALPEEQRRVTQLKLWEGLTFEEIAEAQQIPANTAASRYRYALEKLRTLLRPLYEELKQ
ncbi:MAG TPA: RNA polymerase sigma factor [Verrucomicrobium sp.]|nr:RNA polymerase sigma factor [Verrucomicrobium sp.]